MPGCVQNFDRQLSDSESLTVFCHVHREFGIGTGPVYDRGTRSLAQVNMTAYKVGVKMSFKNVFDPGLSFIGQRQVRINITEWVDDSRFSVAFNIIGRLTKATGVQLLNEHKRLQVFVEKSFQTGNGKFR